ncbi:p48 polypeptide of DNA primase [Coemansia sp. RSA 552]|nr:p48 polypeptide of DNA primase [Coemansia sp. RSA 552]
MAMASTGDEAMAVDRDGGVVDDGTDEVSMATLSQYYQRVFPHAAYYNWLNYNAPSPTSEFTYREFSFTIKDGIYLRYQSFRDSSELQREMQRQAPSKVDIGAIFTAPPRQAKTLQPGAFRPVAKELVFDIDMTDYDEVRTCCQGGQVCERCWRFVAVAMHVMDQALREDFGFEKLLWVYSGRRGVHCWVCDERARRLDDTGRRAVAGYLTLIRGGADQSRKVTLSTRQAAHPHVVRSLEIIEDHFEELLLVDQEILLTRERWMRVLAALPDEDLRQEIDAKWSRHPDQPSVEKWSEMIDMVDKRARKRGAKFGLAAFERDMMLQLTYPRLDENVTTHLNHLLKSPFCIHPKTGRVCTPIPRGRFDTFDPVAVPRLGELLRELSQGAASATALDEYVAEFEKFVATLEPATEAKPSGPSLEF